MIVKFISYFSVFVSSLVLTLVLTPVVREMNRRLGMVDAPDKRRINKVPIPRGGGLAVVLGMALPYLAALYFLPGAEWLADTGSRVPLRLGLLASLMALLGYVDDRFSLRPLIKLAGQVLISFGAWWWAGVGFHEIFPSLPAWADCLITMFWIVGAVNAFNLIDGMDGLATGLAFIATLGVAGAMFFIGKSNTLLSSFAFMGALLGFLRYNFNPASVFLGDCGSMFIGFVVSAMPLVMRSPDSFLVSVGVPLLAMGVPIFDTALAILRRTIRRLLGRSANCDSGNGKIMTADTDHLHHRILRSAGMSQRRAALILYGIASAAVAVGLVGVWLQNNAGGLWLLAFTLATVVVFRDMSKIELFDAGKLLNTLAHGENSHSIRVCRRLAVPFYVALDIGMLFAVLIICHLMLGVDIDSALFRVDFIVRISVVFGFLVAMRVYSTVWSRAMPFNYMQMLMACFFGSSIGSAILYYVPGEDSVPFVVMTISFAALGFIALMSVRTLRTLLRDIFYMLDSAKLGGRRDVSRVLVYGAGLRYRAFRRELVRSFSANSRIIVGIVDDDVFLAGKYVGEVKVIGQLEQLREIVNATNADSIVLTCKMSEERRRAIMECAASLGVKVSEFSMQENDLGGRD